ncbi:MAG: type IV secretory system conjugative DNA transfer family protein [Parcubacteria group bacterium]
MANSDEERITYFAETDSRHERKPFGIKSTDRSKHVYVIGKTGMGKSTLLENMAIQDIKNGEGLAFIDPHGGTAEKLLEYIPEERIKDVLYLAPFDMDHPVSFNIMEDVGANKRHLVVNGLMSVFEKIWEDAWSARMAYILQNTLLALLEYPGATLLAVNRMYTDKEFRNKVVANATDVSVKSFWVDEYAKYTDKYAQEATPAIQNKIGQFAGNPLIRNIIGQSKSSFDLRQIMDEKKIMIVNLSKGRVGEGNARLLGSMLITKIYLAAMSRADESSTALAKLPQFYLHVDEFQSFADKSFADILSEARKYKLNLTMAHQYIEQMEEEVRDAVFGNVGTMIVFRVGAYDADVLEKEFAPVFTAEDLVNLGLRQIYLKLMIDSVSSPPFSATTLPPIQLPRSSYVKEIVANSRQVFSRPRSEVEKNISDWHDEGKKVAPPVQAASFKPAPAQAVAPKPVPKAIDPRGFRERPAPPPAPINKQPEKISLSHLTLKTDNQRKPDVRRVSDLRDALKAVVGNQPKTPIPPPVQAPVQPQPKSQPQPQPQAKKEPSPEELKKILNV